jgi:hypothetical protein
MQQFIPKDTKTLSMLHLLLKVRELNVLLARPLTIQHTRQLMHVNGHKSASIQTVRTERSLS